MEISSLPKELPALCFIALLLGMRHGFDADHLAAIDGLTRSCSRHRPRLARSAGLLFSLGHGTVVIAVALAVAHLQGRWQVPAWLETTGAWISIAALFALAGINGFMLWRARGGGPAGPMGWRSVALSRLLRAQRAWSIWLVGSLFAISFDTISQAGLFAIAATRLGGWEPSLILALVFTAGMLLTDGFNGLVVSGLIKRADEAAASASRVMSGSVIVTSLLTGLVGLASQLMPAVDGWMEERGWALSLSVIAIVLLGFAASMVLARRLRAGAAAG